MNHNYDIVQQPFDLAFFSVSAIRAALVKTSWIFIFSNAEHSITSCADTCVPTFLPSSKLKYFIRKKGFQTENLVRISDKRTTKDPRPNGSSVVHGPGLIWILGPFTEAMKTTSGKRTSARVNFGTRTSAQVINFGTRNLFTWCRS